MRKIAVIGGGASGLAAAVAAKQGQAYGLNQHGPIDAEPATDKRDCIADSIHVTVFEKADRIGKSILASGNGRCNFSNSHIEADAYFNADFVKQSFKVLPPQEVHSFFKDIGLLWHEEGEGRLYPLTNKASSVLDVLRYAAECAGVEFVTQRTTRAVTPVKNRFLVSLDDDTSSFFDAVIVACGGKVTRSLLLPNYSFLNTQPMLGPLKTDTGDIRGLDNLRVRCSISAQGRTERGEVLFRCYGVSGIAVFNLSRFVEEGDRIALDFFPDMSHREVEHMIAHRAWSMGRRPAIMLCAGMLQAPLARALLRKAGIDGKAPLPKSGIAAFVQVLKGFALTVKGIEDFRQCQVSRGGFAVEGFDPASLQSKTDTGLYVVGEALDIDGPCGGYNLHWAWTSGILAGRSAARSPIS